MVFVARYLDLFTNFYSLYNSAMKIFYIAASGGIVYALYKKEPWHTSYITNTAPRDTFQHYKFAVAPCVALALILNEGSFSSVSRRHTAPPLLSRFAPCFSVPPPSHSLLRR
jgi:hypothetical protein